MFNPFDEWRSKMEELDESTRRARKKLNMERDDIGVSLLQQGYPVAKINALLGIKSPNWLYEACERLDLGTPGAVRAKALAERQPSAELVIKPIDGGYVVSAELSDESATFLWDVEAGAYTVPESRTQPDSALNRAVRRYGGGLLPFPYPTPTT